MDKPTTGKLIISTGHQHGQDGVPHHHAFHSRGQAHIHPKGSHGPVESAERVSIDKPTPEPTPESAISYAAYMLFQHEPPTTNVLRFATSREAEDYGLALFSRWTQPTGYEVRPTTDPVSHCFEDGHAVSIHTTPYGAAYDAVAKGALPEGAGDASAERESPLEGGTTDASN